MRRRGSRFLKALVALALAAVTLTSCGTSTAAPTASPGTSPTGFSETSVDARAKAVKTQAIDVADFLSIDCRPIEVLEKDYTHIGTVGIDRIRRVIRVENVTARPLAMRFRVLLDGSFAAKYSETGDEILATGPTEIFTLEVGKGFTIDVQDGVVDDADLTDAQRTEKRNTQGIYYLEFCIDGTWVYVKSEAGPSAES